MKLEKHIQPSIETFLERRINFKPLTALFSNLFPWTARKEKTVSRSRLYGRTKRREKYFVFTAKDWHPRETKFFTMPISLDFKKIILRRFLSIFSTFPYFLSTCTPTKTINLKGKFDYMERLRSICNNLVRFIYIIKWQNRHVAEEEVRVPTMKLCFESSHSRFVMGEIILT